jgi:hypothetical protein
MLRLGNARFGSMRSFSSNSLIIPGTLLCLGLLLLRR